MAGVSLTLAAARWVEETTYIIGGGPSAGDHDLARLRGIVVAVNDSGRKLPGADVLFSADLLWVQRRAGLIDGFRGDVVVALPSDPRKARRCTVPERAVRADRRNDLNSGLEALYWVADRGARSVVLVGFDLTVPAHWHDGYEWSSNALRSVQYPKWLEHFEAAAVEMQDRGVSVLNANPYSAIRCFPFVALEAAA